LNRLLRFFLDLCLLKAAPQDAPASQALLGLTLIANLLVGVALAARVLGGVIPAFAASLIDAALMLGLLWVVLRVRGRPARFLQAATAVLGSGALLAALALPLQPLAAAGQQRWMIGELAGIFTIGLMVWMQVVTGHILRHALEVSLLVGVLLAIAYMLLSNRLLATLFPSLA